MSTTVQQLFKKFKIRYQSIKWGNSISNEEEGIYIISTSKDPFLNKGIKRLPKINSEVLRVWINELPNLFIDNKKATVAELKERLFEFWLPDENILYIGKAPKRKKRTGIGTRVEEYYKTKIGAKSPHSGGQWIKTLSDIESLYVYYGICENSKDIEERMLKYFMENVSEDTLLKLYDKKLPLPFANIRYRGRKDKNTGIKNQRRK